jgi:hypothetical protein
VTDAHYDTWTPIGRAYSLARLSDIIDEAREALRAGSSAASMTALTNIIRMAKVEVERQRAVDLEVDQQLARPRSSSPTAHNNKKVTGC